MESRFSTTVVDAVRSALTQLSLQSASVATERTFREELSAREFMDIREVCFERDFPNNLRLQSPPLIEYNIYISQSA